MASRSAQTPFGNQFGLDGVAITPDGGRAYATGYKVRENAPTLGVVAVLDTSTNAVLASVVASQDANNADVAITPDGSRAYVSTSTPRLAVIDTATTAASRSPRSESPT